MARFWILLTLGVAVGVAGVAWYVAPARKARGYGGLEFAAMTPAASARAPLLTARGALVFAVANPSPSDAAGIHAGEVVAAIDGTPVNSAAQASGIVRAHHAGDRVTFTLFDEPGGDIHPKDVTVVFAAAPPVIPTRHTVLPPRTLAREDFALPSMAANAAWSRRIALGANIKPLALPGLGAGGCNGFAPEGWEVRGHAADDSMFHIAAKTGFQHAIFLAAPLNGRDPRAFVLALLQRSFGAAPTTAQPQPQPFGFTLLDFGTARGAAGFADYRVTPDGKTGKRIAVWIAATAAADASWAEPLAGAAAFSLHCRAPGAPAPRPRPAALAMTSVSLACIQGTCGESDLAGAYLKVLRRGYVHDRDGATWLINPRRDFWQNGADGPGYYRQKGGINEKLEPGRTN